jgi:hypothetical protein
VTGAGVELRVLPGALAIARLDPADPPPAWAAPDGAFHAVVRTADELSVVCPDDAVPGGVRAERGFRALQVAGPLDFGLTGVLAALAVPLAEAGVPIFAIATYDTDYVLVRAEHLGAAVDALRAAGHQVGSD